MLIKIEDGVWINSEEIVTANVIHLNESEEHAAFLVLKYGPPAVVPAPDGIRRNHDACHAWLDDVMRSVNYAADTEPSDAEQAERDRVSAEAWQAGYDNRGEQLKRAEERVTKRLRDLEERAEELRKNEEELASTRAQFEWRSGPQEPRTFSSLSTKEIDGREAYALVEKITHRQPMSNYTLASKLLGELGYTITDNEDSR